MVIDDDQTIEKIKTEKDPFRKAHLIRSSIKSGKITIKDSAHHLNKTSSYICHLLRLLQLPTIVIDGYYSRTVSLSHLFIISRLKDQKEVIKAYECVLMNNYTVQQLEEYVREKLYSIHTVGDRIDPQTVQRIERLFQSIDSNTTVSTIQTRIRTSLIIRLKGSMKKTSAFLRTIATHF
ncbi:MAG TPA: hypothetical protein VJB63_02705 [Patescibacteria group bacterium]|nr:hypothetical protein [Patescibacteria group bacterium]